MVPSNIKEPFFSLVRLGIGHQSGYPIPNQVDWNELEALAAEQGLSAVVVDGVDRLPLEARPPKLVLLQCVKKCCYGFGHSAHHHIAQQQLTHPLMDAFVDWCLVH